MDKSIVGLTETIIAQGLNLVYIKCQEIHNHFNGFLKLLRV